jgi:hypothetical protein
MKGSKLAVAENEIISVTEARGVSENDPTVYTVLFHPQEPSLETVDAAVDMLGFFKEISWDFILVADMRLAPLGSQLSYVKSYSRLIRKIANKNCKLCIAQVPHLPPSSAWLQPILSGSLKLIVGALGVKLEIRTGDTPV